MRTTLSECAVHIESLSQADWQQLLNLIPEIERTTIYGERGVSKHTKEGVRTIPYWEPIPVVEKFSELCYNLGIVIDFDWICWDRGKELLKGDKSEIDNIDLLTLCKLITTVIRSDRFCEGSLISWFQSGLILTLLKRIENLRHSFLIESR